MTPIESATVDVTEDALRITVPLASLAAWASDLWEAGGYGLKLVDVRAFAEGVKDAIQEEDENGDWPLHAMLDRCISDASEGDLPGVEEVDDDQDD